MSEANKCDRCGKCYEPTQGSAYIAEIGVAQAAPKTTTFDNWSDIDLCPACARPVLEALGTACQGLTKILRSRRTK